MYSDTLRWHILLLNRYFKNVCTMLSEPCRRPVKKQKRFPSNANELGRLVGNFTQAGWQNPGLGN